MSPEQLEAGEPDPRTDIFAFGAVLYELVTGRKAFEGKSQASLISSIMTSQPPPLTELVPMTPPALERVVKTCLAKDPEDRWQSARDLKHALESVLEPTRHFRPEPKQRRWAYWIAITTLAIIASGLALARFLETQPERTALQFQLERPEAAGQFGFALSPDRRRITAVARPGLWVRELDSLEWRVLEGTDGARAPFWSYDSASIGFFADKKLKIIPAAGGISRTMLRLLTGEVEHGTVRERSCSHRRPQALSTASTRKTASPPWLSHSPLRVMRVTDFLNSCPTTCTSFLLVIPLPARIWRVFLLAHWMERLRFASCPRKRTQPSYWTPARKLRDI